MLGNDWWLRVADLAADQGGLLTTAQAKTVGVSPQQIARLARSGVLERVVHGVYRLAGTAHDPLADLRAAWLALEPETLAGDRLAGDDPGGVVSHRSAAVLHGLGDLDADLHEFTVATRRRSRNPEVRFHTGVGGRGNWIVVAGLPVSTVVQTITDLARARTDGGHLAGVVSDGLSGLHVGLDEVAAALRPFAHYYGAPLGDGARLVEQFLDEAGIPEATIALARAATRTAATTTTTRSQAAEFPLGAALSESLAQTVQYNFAELTSHLASDLAASVMRQSGAAAVNESLIRSIQQTATDSMSRGVLDSLTVLNPQLSALANPLGEAIGGETFRALQQSLMAQASLSTDLARSGGLGDVLARGQVSSSEGGTAGDRRADEDAEPS